MAKFLPLCCSGGGVLSPKPYWWSLLHVPHDEAVDRELKLENRAFPAMVVAGVVPHYVSVSIVHVV